MEPVFKATEVLAVVSAGIYGILLARRNHMDLVGVFSVAFILAFGGGTLRDLFLDRHPLFWIREEAYPLIIFGLVVTSAFIRRLPSWLVRSLYVPDALGLGFFSILGTGLALEAGTSWFVASLLGVVTGTFGGVMGDVICNEVPSLFRTAPLYATCSFTGGWVYLGLQSTPIDTRAAVGTGIAVIVLFRVLAVRRDWRLPNYSALEG